MENTLLFVKQGITFSWNRRIGAWFAFWWKGTTLYRRGISRQVLNTSNVLWKKVRKCLQQQRASFTPLTWHSKIGWSSARLQKGSYWKYTERCQCYCPVPKSSILLYKEMPSLEQFIDFRSVQSSSVNNVEFQKWPSDFLAHTTRRTGLSSTGTEHKLGFMVPKPLIAAVTRPSSQFIIHLDKILNLHTEDGNEYFLWTLTRATADKPSQQLHISSSIIKFLNGIMCFTAGFLWYKYSITKLAIFYKKCLLLTWGKVTPY